MGGFSKSAAFFMGMLLLSYHILFDFSKFACQSSTLRFDSQCYKPCHLLIWLVGACDLQAFNHKIIERIVTKLQIIGKGMVRLFISIYIWEKSGNFLAQGLFETIVTILQATMHLFCINDTKGERKSRDWVIFYLLLFKAIIPWLCIAVCRPTNFFL